MFTLKILDRAGAVLAESNSWPHALRLAQQYRWRGIGCHVRVI